MNFLPLEDVKVAWVHDEQGRPCEGHAWYDGKYCRFELDCSDSEPHDRASCLVYLLYSMKGETLVNELARRKLFELGDGGALSANAEFKPLIHDGRTKRSEELQFVGRFIGLPSRQGRSVEFVSSEDDDRGQKPTQTWFAPITRVLGGVLHKQAASCRAG